MKNLIHKNPTRSEYRLASLASLKSVTGYNNFPKIEDVEMLNDSCFVSFDGKLFYPVTVFNFSNFYKLEKQKYIHKLGLMRKSLIPTGSVDELYDDHYLTIDVYKIDSKEAYDIFCSHEDIFAMQKFNNPQKMYYTHTDDNFDYLQALHQSHEDIKECNFSQLRTIDPKHEWLWLNELRRFSLANVLLRNGCIDLAPFKYGSPDNWHHPEITHGFMAVS